MYLLEFKIIAAITIFVLSLSAGLISLKLNESKAKFLQLGDAFASGIFLSAAFLHLLPEAVQSFGTLSYNNQYPIAELLCIISFVVLLTLERAIIIYGNKHLSNKNILAPLLLVSLLGIHSLVEGAAIGSNKNLLEASVIFCAVIAHKGSESFALAINLSRHKLAAANIKHIITLFSTITPIGIFLASFVLSSLNTNTGHILSATFNAIAAGTFIYLGTEHLFEHKKSYETFNEILALIIGIIMMALVAIWI